MSSKAGSTFVTFLMSIPFAAVGLMAVFGVPPLSSVIAASRGLNDKIQEFSEDDRGSKKSTSHEFEDWDSSSDSAPGWSEEGTDLSKSETKATKKSGEVDSLGFSKLPGEKTDNSSRDGRNRRAGLKTRDELGNLVDSMRSDRDKPSDVPIDFKDDKQAPPASMKESLKKLNALGVKHYHLERGADQDTWLFVCLFSPGDETRVTHRFEAESEDPEGAVSETLQQIDVWLLKRFRDKQPISQNAL